MKKLLSILASTGLMATTAASVVACGPKTPDEKPPIDNSEKKEAVLKKIKEIQNDENSFIFEGQVKQDIVEGKLKSYLKEFENVTFKTNNFQNIKVNGDGIEKGNLDVNISVDGEEFPNPDPDFEKGNFQFSFINEEFSQINGLLTKIKNGVNVNLSDFNIEGLGPIGSLFNLVGDVIKTGDWIPEKIPTTFDETDENWNHWTSSMEKIRVALGKYIDIDQELSFGHIDNEDPQDPIKFPIPGMEKDLYITIDTKISDILNAILPDLIHFRNFMVEQQADKNENILLLLIQYLFNEPKNINDDGFEDINKDIKDFKPETNLENLLYDILEGWKNVNGKILNNAPLKITIGGYLLSDDSLLSIPVKYHTKTLLGFPVQLGLIDVLPIENIKAFISQLFDHKLSDPLNLTIVLPEIKIGEINIGGDLDIDLGTMFLNDAIKSGLKNILNTDKSLENQLDNWIFEWKQGTLKVEISKGNNEWVFAEKFEDILTAKDLRVKFASNTLEMKFEDWNFVLENIDITLNLDLKSSVIC